MLIKKLWSEAKVKEEMENCGKRAFRVQAEMET